MHESPAVKTISLVTGASGFIGSRLIKILSEKGASPIRAFVRSLPSPPSDCKSIEYFKGNLLSYDDCFEACRDVETIYHLAAGREKSFTECFRNSVIATRNLLQAAHERDVKKIIIISSMSVYDYSKSKRIRLIDETWPVDTGIARRNDPYAYGKLRQEELARDLSEKYAMECVVMRPGNVFGPGKSQLPGRVLLKTFGIALQPGGNNRIPFTYVDNCAEAIAAAGMRKDLNGEIFNIVDDVQPKARAFLKRYKKETGYFFSLSVPFPLWRMFCHLIEIRSIKTKGQIPMILNRRKCDSYWKSNRYSNAKLRKMLEWAPGIGYEEALSRFFAYVSGLGDAK